MKRNNYYNKSDKRVCVGMGLVALDLVMNGNPKKVKYYVGGSCGNVLTILSYFGWNSYPIARLADNKYTTKITNDLNLWSVRTDFITKSKDGSTPLIIHRIKKNKKGEPIHRFEFKWPNTNNWLPSFKPILAKSILNNNYEKLDPNVYYFDKICRASIELGKLFRKKGAIIVFEPSSIKDIDLFKECLEISHIIKFSHERLKNYKELFPKTNVPLEIETLGREGLNFRTKFNKKWKLINPIFTDNYEDTAGSGDWYTATIINLICKHNKLLLENDYLKEIEDILSYSQILSALNCMFEGARGLMYNIKRKNILEIIENF